MYEWNGGMPSGHPITTIGNIIINNVALRYCIGDILLEPKGGALMYSWAHKNPLKDIEKHIMIVAFGDDNVLALSSWLCQHITQAKLTKSMRIIGLIYTDENKSDREIELRKLEDISFLKRRFVWNPLMGRYDPPLPREVVLEMAMWTHRKEKAGAFQSTIDMQNRELAYLRSDWEVYFPLICKALRDNGCSEYPSELNWRSAYAAAISQEAYHC